MPCSSEMISQNLAPIWLPHWPAWMWTISLMMLLLLVGCCWSGGRLKTDWLSCRMVGVSHRYTGRAAASCHTLDCPLPTSHLTPHTSHLTPYSSYLTPYTVLHPSLLSLSVQRVTIMSISQLRVTCERLTEPGCPLPSCLHMPTGSWLWSVYCVLCTARYITQLTHHQPPAQRTTLQHTQVISCLLHSYG